MYLEVDKEAIGWRPAVLVRSGLSAHERQEAILEEAALSLVINGASYAVMMVTPIDRDDFVRGFLWSEGILRDITEVIAWEWVTTAAGHWTAYLQLAPPAAQRAAGKRRELVGASACGLCGIPRFDGLVPFPSVPVAAPLRPDWVHEQMTHMVRQQTLNHRTGTAHAAILAGTAGTVVREDIGRHNAVDKVIGAALARGWRPGDAVLLGVSSRLSFEIALKAAGFAVPAVAAISGVSSLAIHTAESHGLMLAGYARDGRMTIYAHSEHLAHNP
ncbi:MULTISPECIES: formate dehydrogenase accessory sulfurtransferase FdhD [Acidiferrobacter]|jgi:FdhD protein|uniref:Sulfur carrier protein FdhD n=1 Tax=Acidiferrobacter thiooxydans TaxID=163359 RepID=A0A1C2G0U9_9GAMM|nr:MULTISPECIES: formate dehydrogenase accessory sulfurtransferase FdhD [Acidiferrobacter]RCN55857.1 formate dehydrogenase accessory sulfurtransferase FdhD [Acidiferrobacter thiooxydans]UEN98892.1 formate dehydrogenase accessory sulfurtransferase FdhD [Acidiferrobacter thiooxydans]